MRTSVKETRGDVAKATSEKREYNYLYIKRSTYRKVIRDERTVISNGDEGVNIPLDCGNKTGTGLVENEVTRRGNSSGATGGSEEKIPDEGSNERAEGWKKNHVKYLFPRGAGSRPVSPRKIGESRETLAR